MAERRMMSKKIIHSDMFMDLPATSKNLYFYLMIEADDDGFVNSPKRIQRMVGATDDDSALLVAKNFVITFESGVIVIKHWRIHNYIRSDRHKGTSHIEEMEKITIKDSLVYQVSPKCQPSGSIGKVRLGEVRVGKVNKAISKFEIFTNEVEEAFIDNKISTFKAKINKTKQTKEAFSKLSDTNECKTLFVEYVKRLKNGASRLDTFITAYIEGNLEGIEYTSDKFNVNSQTKSPPVMSIAWQMEQEAKQQEGVIDVNIQD